MKKFSLLLLVLSANFSLYSCTEENIADITDPPGDIYATDGEDEHTDPPEEPPTGG